ncbi:MAG: SUMF1/EgtB/PvdO family nonheme iron enzyme [Deltaproteobacteria bacterium]|nr:SUMF1/EgtB/PvdO family nonheme iron enzyme [Deltaproteobacteria bacterium]
MLGNVDEWCWDWYGDYARDADVDPSGSESEPPRVRVMRGGSWAFWAGEARAANRSWIDPWNREFDVGFRPVRSGR